MKRVVTLFEHVMWRGRLFIVVAVVALLIAWLMMLYITTVDVVHLFRYVWNYTGPVLDTAERDALRLQIISMIIGVVDGYLIASALFLLAIGFYKQFVGNIEIIDNADIANRILDVRTFEDLKVRLARVIVLILIVKFLQQALRISYRSPEDLLYLGIGVVLIGGAVFLSHLAGRDER